MRKDGGRNGSPARIRSVSVPRNGKFSEDRSGNNLAGSHWEW